MKLKNPALLPGVDLSQVIRTVGEPAGQAPTMCGNTIQFTLLGSGLTGWYSTSYFSQPSWIPDGPELVPDLPVSIRSTDYFARFDSVMATILAGGGVALAAPSGDVITVNGASLSPHQGVAPGSFATTFGSFPGVPDEVQVDGKVGRIVFASSSQVNFIVPDSVTPGPATISVRASGKEMYGSSHDCRLWPRNLYFAGIRPVAAGRGGESGQFGKQRIQPCRQAIRCADLRYGLRRRFRHSPDRLRGHLLAGSLQRDGVSGPLADQGSSAGWRLGAGPRVPHRGWYSQQRCHHLGPVEPGYGGRGIDFRGRGKPFAAGGIRCRP